MHKIIHSNFELDLTNYNIATVEDNHWFSDQFFTKYSFPFNVYLTDELIKVFGDLLDDNNVIVETYFEVTYVLGNTIESAIFEINNQEGKKLRTTLRYGFDELPNWNKKLNELPLEEVAITDIYAHAKTIISKTWPETNYNFPQIHTDKYDTDSATWATFQKIINNYAAGEFLTNTNAVEDFANRNIIQPLPSFLHVLTVLFSDAGYTLKGDVTTNETFQKLLLFTDLDYFTEIGNPIALIVNKNEYQSTLNGVAYYNNTHNLIASNTYRITGTASLFTSGFSPKTTASVKISYKGTELYAVYTSLLYGTPDEVNLNVDITLETNADVSAQSLLLEAHGDFDDRIGTIFDLQIERVLEDSPNEIQIKNELNLKNVVPNITGGAFVTVIKNWFNLNLEIVGNDIYMNFIEDEINYNDAVDLRNYEELKPFKSYNNNISFLLKFEDVDSEIYSYDKVFQNKTITELSDNLVDDDTKTIEIAATPLLQKNILGINTANAFDHSGNTKIYAVLYNGVNEDGLNLTEDSNSLLIPYIHENYYKNWFKFRINAVTYKWSFKMFAENLTSIKKKVFAYGRYHVVKSLNKTQIAKDLFEIEIESDTIN